MNRHWNRRDFLKTAGAATLGALAAGAPRRILAADQPAIRPAADTVIVLWMARWHGIYGDIRSQTLRAFFQRHAGLRYAEHVPANRHGGG